MPARRLIHQAGGSISGPHAQLAKLVLPIKAGANGLTLSVIAAIQTLDLQVITPCLNH